MHDAGHIQFESVISVECDNRLKYFCGTGARASVRFTIATVVIDQRTVSYLRSACGDANAGLELHCPHMAYDKFRPLQTNG